MKVLGLRVLSVNIAVSDIGHDSRLRMALSETLKPLLTLLKVQIWNGTALRLVLIRPSRRASELLVQSA